MSLFASLLFTGAILVSANLDHFKMDELSASFKGYEISIPADCNQDINSCLAEHHAAAKACVSEWMAHGGKYVEECTSDPEMAQLSKTWQEASFHWHKAVDSCLQGKEPPAEAASSAMFIAFLKRKKRSSHSNHGHHDHAHGDSDSHESCFQRVQEKAAVCNSKVVECAPLAKCWGVGDAPSADTAHDVTWFEHAKELRDTTKTSMAAYKTKMMACVSQKRADDMKSLLKDFNMAALSAQFRLFDLSATTCNPDIWQCVANLHERARMCVGLQQTENEQSAKYAECSADADIIKAKSDWEKASGKWHKGLDMCLAGQAVPEEEETESVFYLLRRKRNTETGVPGPSHPHRHRGHGPRVFANAAECWRDVGTHKRDCAMKAKECTVYSVCSAMEGTEVPEDKQAWFDRSKQLKDKQMQTMGDYEKKLHDCLGTPVPMKAMEADAEHKMSESTW